MKKNRVKYFLKTYSYLPETLVGITQQQENKWNIFVDYIDSE